MNIKSKITEITLRKLEKIADSKLTLGKLIWAIRRSDDMSQITMAEKLEISKQQLCDIEHDRKLISPKLAANYADKLGYSKEQFIRLSLQDMLDKEGLLIDVEIKPRSKRSFRSGLRFAHA